MTKFPVSIAKEIRYSVQKRFDDSVFHVLQIWEDEHETVVHKNIFSFKHFDPFLNYADGIYEISKYDYIRFCRAKKRSMTLNRDYRAFYMLKKKR